MDHSTPHPLRFKKSGWLKRPKTQETMVAQVSMDDLHSHMEPVPSLPFSQKAHRYYTAQGGDYPNAARVWAVEITDAAGAAEG